MTVRIREENINTPEFWDLAWELEAEGSGLTIDRWTMLTANLEPEAVNILDVGGGRGEFLFWLGERTDDVRYRTIFDQSRCGVAIAISRGRADAGFVGDCLELPFDDDTFDATFCNEVIEHVEGPQILVDELLRVTRKGGLVGITTPLDNTTDDKQHVWSISVQDVKSFFPSEPTILIGSGPTIVAMTRA